MLRALQKSRLRNPKKRSFTSRVAEFCFSQLASHEEKSSSSADKETPSLLEKATPGKFSVHRSQSSGTYSTARDNTSMKGRSSSSKKTSALEKLLSNNSSANHSQSFAIFSTTRGILQEKEDLLVKTSRI